MKQLQSPIKDILLPYLKNDLNDDQLAIINWVSFENAFLNYEKDSNGIEKIINSLNLKDATPIIKNLSKIHESFIDEIAEEFVVGNPTVNSKKLLDKNHTLFMDRVSFYKTLKGVLTKLERKRIVEELNAEATFSEKYLQLAFKKKGRTDLKAKFKEWDKELVKEKKVIKMEPPETRKTTKSLAKVISLSWSKIAIAASIALLIGIPLFNNFNTPNTYSFQTTILSQSGMGFANNENSNKIEVVFKDDSGLFKSEVKNEYTFFKNRLIIFSEKPKGKFHLLVLNDDQFYILLENDFYPIIETEISHPLVVEKDSNTIEQLKKIIFNNE